MVGRGILRKAAGDPQAVVRHAAARAARIEVQQPIAG